MTGYDETKKEFILSNDYDPRDIFCNYDISKIFGSVPNWVSIYFCYDWISGGELKTPVILLNLKGSEEIVSIEVMHPHVIRNAVLIRDNELFSPRDQGIIYIQETSHNTLMKGIQSIQSILNARLERMKEEESV